MINNKIYDLYLQKLKNFSLTVSSFRIGVGLSLIIRSLFIRINAVLSLTMQFAMTMKLKISIVSLTQILQNVPVTIRLLGPKINSISSALLYATSTLGIKIPILANLSQIGGVFTTIGMKIHTQGTAVLGTFYLLSDWDASTLGSMDSATLGNTDFHI